VGRRSELEQEQAYVSMLYERLDGLRERTRRQLERAFQPDGGGHFQARLDRDAFAARHADRLAQLDAAEDRLCFGRLDLGDGSRLYVGRIGLLDDDREPLLVDWRAPAAQPFYRATPAAPCGVVRRRHLKTRARVVLDFEDDVLDLDALSEAEREGLNGEAALLAALGASRTGRMTDIVATIQAEQDRVIRSELPGILVVQGGPGTGKTAVALHRAAYLLYTHRERLARRGVLVVGPNPTFLRYIEQVLPSLGERDVLLSTVEELHPGVAATGREPGEVAAVKGDLRMAGVLAAAVRDRRWVPTAPLEIEVDGATARLEPETCARARDLALATARPHNQARAIFVREVATALARQVAQRMEEDLAAVEVDESLFGPDEQLDDGPLLDDEQLADLRDELLATPAVRAALDRLWPELTPPRLLADLFQDQKRLAAAAPDLTAAERAVLLRPARSSGGSEWTAADVPLLDEAAVLLGTDDEVARRADAARAERERRELAYARGVLEVATIGDAARFAPDASQLDPAMVADRWRRSEGAGTIAERARQDRTWTFGHVIVDEAQEVSAMAWRMLLRRCPTRSMTLVGDVAQTGAPWGAGSWTRALDPHAPGRWRVAELTVNYRTPAEIMAIAADVLAAVAPGLKPPRSVREAGTAPWHLELDPAELPGRLPEVVAAEAAAVGDGKVAVLVPAGRAPELGELLAAALPAATAAQGPAVLDAPIAVLTPTQAKGLEFDAVLVVEPADILDGSPRGGNDLYVALTRATARLGVVHTGPLPAALAGLEGSGEPHERGGRSPPRTPQPGAPVNRGPVEAAQAGGSSGR
jgi:DNA helicase IV